MKISIRYFFIFFLISFLIGCKKYFPRPGDYSLTFNGQYNSPTSYYTTTVEDKKYTVTIEQNKPSQLIIDGQTWKKSGSSVEGDYIYHVGTLGQNSSTTYHCKGTIRFKNRKYIISGTYSASDFYGGMSGSGSTPDYSSGNFTITK